MCMRCMIYSIDNENEIENTNKVKCAVCKKSSHFGNFNDIPAN